MLPTSAQEKEAHYQRLYKLSRGNPGNAIDQIQELREAYKKLDPIQAIKLNYLLSQAYANKVELHLAIKTAQETLADIHKILQPTNHDKRHDKATSYLVTLKEKVNKHLGSLIIMKATSYRKNAQPKLALEELTTYTKLPDADPSQRIMAYLSLSYIYRRENLMPKAEEALSTTFILMTYGSFRKLPKDQREKLTILYQEARSYHDGRDLEKKTVVHTLDECQRVSEVLCHVEQYKKSHEKTEEQSKKIIAAFEKIIRQDSTETYYASLQLGFFYRDALKQSDLDNAIKCFQYAQDKKGLYAIANMALGVTYERLGATNCQTAKNIYIDCLKHPDIKLVERAQLTNMLLQVNQKLGTDQESLSYSQELRTRLSEPKEHEKIFLLAQHLNTLAITYLCLLEHPKHSDARKLSIDTTKKAFNLAKQLPNTRRKYDELKLACQSATAKLIGEGGLASGNAGKADPNARNKAYETLGKRFERLHGSARAPTMPSTISTTQSAPSKLPQATPALPTSPLLSQRSWADVARGMARRQAVLPTPAPSTPLAANGNGIWAAQATSTKPSAEPSTDPGARNSHSEC